MAGLKELRTRIESIKSTQKITSAMKLVAAARLRRAQGLIGKSAFYSNNILAAAARVLYEIRQEETEKNIQYVYPELMRGNGGRDVYLLLVLTSDRGPAVEKEVQRNLLQSTVKTMQRQMAGD